MRQIRHTNSTFITRVVFWFQVYSTSDEDMALTSCDLTNSSDWLLVGRKDGAVMLLDVRAGKWPKCFWKLHGQSIKTVHLHPTDNKYFATASRDGYVKGNIIHSATV